MNSGKPRLIETDSFPYDFLSSLAERESWRKEVYRPIYHVHKWWAKRLGSIFRGMLLGCLLRDDAEFESAFYERHDFSGLSVFDPFMGSGTTVGEAHKLGLTALGRDINPVACESVRVALGPIDKHALKQAYEQLSQSVGIRIRELYATRDARGRPAEVLYYFWVKTVPCPGCGDNVDLFSSRIIARNAYPSRKPEVQACCPECGDIFAVASSNTPGACPRCGAVFPLDKGTVLGPDATCAKCRQTFRVLDVVRQSETPPAHRLYGKLVLTSDGEKQYLPATLDDVAAYDRCSSALAEELRQGTIRLPDSGLAHGYNTKQALNYNYRNWRDFFNDRQLLALGWLQEAISAIEEETTRDALLSLFSGVLEFNNLFATYKGEGTGAVRHMFSHHILKPERTPIEANVWGTPRSSGSFSNLFRSRLMRAIEYREAPFEATVGREARARQASLPFSGKLSPWPRTRVPGERDICLSCGSSDSTGLPDRSISLVVTDPPFFDNVHYSELADFFYSWQRLHPRGFINGAITTRHASEVQDQDPASFSTKLRSVFAECRRVLRDDGLLVFTYHHSRHEGWTALASAVIGAGFSIVNAHPVKAEMSVATPKAQAREPIQLDVILVCRKREQDLRATQEKAAALREAIAIAEQKIARLCGIGLTLSLNDRRIILFSQFLSCLGPVESPDQACNALRDCQECLDATAERFGSNSPAATAAAGNRRSRLQKQPSLPFSE